MSKDKNNVPFPRLRDLKLTTKEVEMERKKESEEMRVNKKRKLEWRPEDCAQVIGVSDKCTGEGEKKKCHYKTFQFHANKYGLVSFVLLFRLC